MIQLSKKPPKGVVDPLALASELWPHITFYKKQKQILYSIWDNDETVVPAGNELGKDFIGGAATVLFFLSRHPCRVCTSSATDYHLDVLWAEINRFIQESKYPLNYNQGGPLIIGHRSIKKVVNGSVCPISKVTGIVPAPGKEAALQGFHVDSTDGIPRNLWICDEASGANDAMYRVASGWAKRMYIFGNPWSCSNFFYRAVEGHLETKDPGGDIRREGRPGFYRRVISICAEDSPNVRLGMIRASKGLDVGDPCLLPGVKGYWDYKKHRQLWDAQDQCVKLDGRFYRGKEVMLFPDEYLKMAADRADKLMKEHGVNRKGRTIGVDPAEGGDSTVWTVADSLGLIHQTGMKTPDTTEIVDKTLSLMREFAVSAENVLFDRGGGGYEHACQMRKMGYNVRTVGFGESVMPELKRGLTPLEQRKLQKEEQYAYCNRRAEMYGVLSHAVNPIRRGDEKMLVYGIPRTMTDLVAQLRVIPKLTDPEGRLWLPPKHKSPKTDNAKTKTMHELIGHSPDEADSAVLAYYGIIRKTFKARAGVI